MRSGRIDSAPILTMGVVLALGGFAVLPAALLDVVTDGGHELSLAGAALLLIAFGAPLVWLFRLPSRMSTQGLFSSLVAGALARASWSPKSHTYRDLYEQLCEDGVLVPHSSSSLQFAADQVFSSPSAAAAVVSGRAANGRTQWKVEGTGQTYGEWQDVQVSTVKVASNPA